MSGFEALAELKARMAEQARAGLQALLEAGRFVEAADQLDSSQPPAGLTAQCAYAYYRRALARHARREYAGAISDLHRALNLGGQSDEQRALIQSRLTALQSIGRSPRVRELDEIVAGYFNRGVGQGGVLGEFMALHGLARPNRQADIPNVDALSTIGVYRYAGDEDRNDKWSVLIRSAKGGDKAVIALFSLMLAEHVWSSADIKDWIGEIDCIVPVPSDERRVAEREIDIVGEMAQQLGSRIGLPVRADLLKRARGANHSRHSSRDELLGQYRMRDKKKPVVAGRTILLLDDITTRGFTAGVCAQRLKAAGAARVLVLALAQSETSRVSRDWAASAAAPGADALAPWLCLSETPGLEWTHVRPLLTRFETPEGVLSARELALTNAGFTSTLAKAIGTQQQRLEDYRIKAASVFEEADKRGAFILTLDDENYPGVLRFSDAAPAVLYCLGDGRRALGAKRTVAIVGTRSPTEPAAAAASSVADNLASADFIIVSGLSRGVDCLAHEACLGAEQPTMAFLATGVDVEYPPSAKSLRADIRRHGMLVSPYAFGAPADQHQLRQRQSLIVGASQAVIVIETKSSGGAMDAARAAKALGRPLFCLEPVTGFETEYSGNAELLASGDASALNLADPAMAVEDAIGGSGAP